MDPLTLRFFERLTVVLLGGMTIYFGFRLFIVIPARKDSSGKFSLPWDISIVMTRVGPGVFFALFGVIAVSLALIRPLEMSSQAQRNEESQSDSLKVRYATSPQLGDQTARADARALLRREIAVLNSIPSLLRENLADYERDDIARRIRRIKLALIKPVWGEPDEGFGNFSQFERWVEGDETVPIPADMKGALALYNYGLKEKQP